LVALFQKNLFDDESFGLAEKLHSLL